MAGVTDAILKKMLMAKTIKITCLNGDICEKGNCTGELTQEGKICSITIDDGIFKFSSIHNSTDDDNCIINFSPPKGLLVKAYNQEMRKSIMMKLDLLP